MRFSTCALLFLTAALTVGERVGAQEDPEPTVHWAYSPYFGTGWYKVNETRSAYVLQTKPRRTFGEAEINDQGERTLEYTFRVPITLGLNKFDFHDLEGIIDPGNLSTLSVNFGADVIIPISRQFSIRPVAEIGYGTILDESESAWNYRAEMRAQYTFEPGKVDWALLGGAGYVGYTPNVGDSNHFTFANLGAEVTHPISWMSSADRQTLLHWNLGFTSFFGDLKFEPELQGSDSVGNFWSFGIAVGRRNAPFRIGFLKFDRIGLAYNYSIAGRLRGVKFIFRTMYDP